MSKSSYALAFLLCYALCLFPAGLHTQPVSFEWITLDGSPCCQDYPHDITSDGKGNVFVTADYSGPGPFGKSTLNEGNALLAYDANGTEQWGRNTVGGGIQDLTVDRNRERLYVAGDSADRFAVTCLTPGGEYRWSVVLPVDSDLIGSALTAELDPDGNIYVGGHIDTRPVLYKFSGDGKRIWDRTFEGTEWSVVASTQDNAGNVYVLTGSRSGNNAMLLYKCRADSGELLWQVYVPGSMALSSVLYDDNGNLLVAGSFFDRLDFGDQSLIAQGNSTNGFVARYDTSLTFRDAVLLASRDQTSIQRLIPDPEGYAMLTGYSSGTLSVGGTDRVLTGDREAILAGIDSDLHMSWFYGTGIGFAEGYGLETDERGILWTGLLFADVDRIGGIALPEHGEDIFVARLARTSSVPERFRDPTGSIQATAEPNPFSERCRVSVSAGTYLERIDVCDATGTTVLTIRPEPGSASVDLEAGTMPEGLYFLEVFTEDGKRRSIPVVRMAR